MRPTLFKITLASCVFLNSPICSAGFSTYANNWPDDASIVNEKVTNEAAKPTCEVVTPDVDVNTEPRISEYKRLYAMFGATFMTAQVRQMQNISQPALSSAVLLNDSAQENYVSWEFGLGTKFKYVRLEAEYLYEKNVPYDATPLFVGYTENLTSTLQNQSVWLNLLYDFYKLNIPYFTPYVGGSLGFIWNKTSSTMFGGLGNNVAENHSRYGFGWGVTIGARMPFWTRWFGYIGYKYLDHGKAVWQDNTGIMQLKGHYVVQGIDVGVQYLLG